MCTSNNKGSKLQTFTIKRYENVKTGSQVNRPFLADSEPGVAQLCHKDRG